MKCARAASWSLAVGADWANAADDRAMTATRRRIRVILERNRLAPPESPRRLAAIPAQSVIADAVQGGCAVAAEVARQRRRLGARTAGLAARRHPRRALGRSVPVARPHPADAGAVGEVVGVAE